MKEWKFTIWYFKPNGKFYAEAEVAWKLRGDDMPYMPDAMAKIRGLRDTGGPGALPGLGCEGWDGFILVNSEEGYPCLIRPAKKGRAE